MRGGGGEGGEERVERKVLGTRGEKGGGILLHEADIVEGWMLRYMFAIRSNIISKLNHSKSS